MTPFELLADLHVAGARQGPGGDRETRLAVELAGLSGTGGLRIADIGCGTGASTLLLAEMLDARITAVDVIPAFLDRLRRDAAEAGVGHRIETVAASMDALPFAESSFDVIWSEGAIYNMGFAVGARAWRRLLTPGGVLAASELTWLTADRPAEIQDHWTAEYPEVAPASQKIGVLEAAGYAPIGYFTLPASCWMETYYTPLRARFDAFLARHGASDAARAIVEAEKREIDLYERFGAYFGYGFYIARRTDA